MPPFSGRPARPPFTSSSNPDPREPSLLTTPTIITLPLNWRPIRSWAASRPFLLRTGDQLGRSRGRLRLLDALRPTVPAPLRPDLSRWHSHDLAAVWVGHATVLLRIGGMTILTDPVFSTR